MENNEYPCPLVCKWLWSTHMEIERVEPAVVANETEMLVGFLEYQRATLALKCEGLDSQQAARRSAPPSTLSPLGIIRHLTDAETFWFVDRFGGEKAQNLYRSSEHPNAAFDDLDGADLDESLERWSQACELSRQIVANAQSMNQLSKGTYRNDQHFTLGWMVHKLTAEYTRHNGHIDLLREAIDGEVGV